MKKPLLVLVLMISILAVNAQHAGTTTTKTKAIHTPIKIADLNKAITDNVAKNHVGFTINKATQVNKNNIITFEIVIVKDTATETLVYDKEGKFIKNKVPKDPAQKKKKK